MRLLQRIITRYRLAKLRRETRGTPFALACRYGLELNTAGLLVSDHGFDEAERIVVEAQERNLEPLQWATQRRRSP